MNKFAFIMLLLASLVRLEEIQEKISDLTRIKTALEHLASSCDGRGSLDECPILEALN